MTKNCFVSCYSHLQLLRDGDCYFNQVKAFYEDLEGLWNFGGYYDMKFLSY